jgi:hypothetical protein
MNKNEQKRTKTNKNEQKQQNNKKTKKQNNKTTKQQNNKTTKQRNDSIHRANKNEQKRIRRSPRTTPPPPIAGEPTVAWSIAPCNKKEVKRVSISRCEHATKRRKR